MQLWLAGAALLLQTGCFSRVARLTIGPTIDSFGNVGGEVKVTLGSGPGSLLLEPTVGVARVALEGGTAFTIRPEVTYWFEPAMAGSARRMPAFRGGLLYSGHFFWLDGQEKRLDGVGFNFAILPRLYAGPPQNGQTLSYHFVHLGVELAGEYDWGSPDVKSRGIFSLGVTLDSSVYQEPHGD
jgi:hypothetical protein